MNALKGQWIVTGGVMPQAESTYTKAWNYTSKDLEKDRDNGDYAIFIEMRDKAYEYAKSLNSPSMLNWVTVNWVWV